MTHATGRRVAVSGASGFIGGALVDSFRADGWEVLRLTRRRAGAEEVEWRPEAGYVDAARLEGIDAFVHLAGESINGLWTPGKKRAILESRARGTRLLATTLASLQRPPRIFVSASGVGYYGNAGEDVLREDSPPGDDFLARVCVAWEDGADAARAAGLRVVHPRFGLVLDPAGGALAMMMPAFRLGAGARLGSGRQWMSWISRTDAVRTVRFAIDQAEVSGAVNATSPQPVRNEEFTRALADEVDRPAFLRIPSFFLRNFTGGMGEALLLASQRAVPAALDAHGFAFEHPSIGTALAAGLDGRG
ncbi:MAG: TIGR01777 family oxidoreductase [Gemmatimonadota bacterium]